MVAGAILFYVWITLLHCLFVGVVVHVFFGNRWKAAWTPVLVCAALLGGIETYWIPIVKSAGASLTVSHPALLRHFSLTPQTNIVPLLGPGIWSPVIWLAQGGLAHAIGSAACRRAQRRMRAL